MPCNAPASAETDSPNGGHRPRLAQHMHLAGQAAKAADTLPRTRTPRAPQRLREGVTTMGTTTTIASARPTTGQGLLGQGMTGDFVQDVTEMASRIDRRL